MPTEPMEREHQPLSFPGSRKRPEGKQLAMRGQASRMALDTAPKATDKGWERPGSSPEQSNASPSLVQEREAGQLLHPGKKGIPPSALSGSLLHCHSMP